MNLSELINFYSLWNHQKTKIRWVLEVKFGDDPNNKKTKSNTKETRETSQLIFHFHFHFHH